MKSLINYCQELGAKSVSKVTGPNGAFISITMKDNSKKTLPIGRRSQAGTISEYNLLEAKDNGQLIATVNHYEEVESLVIQTEEVLP